MTKTWLSDISNHMGAPSLRRCSSPEAFLADPIGASISGRTFAIWVQRPDRLGAIHTAGDQPRDVETIASVFPMFAHPRLAPRYDILHDLRDVQSVDHEMFGFFEGFLRDWIDVLTPRVRRVAVIRPSGLVGGVLAGLFHDWVAGRFEAELFGEREPAYAWLAMTPDEIGEIEAERAALVGPELLRRVRETIELELATASLASLASRLGTGPRTLQRMLQDVGTSLRAEILQVRIEAAKRQLLDADDKVSSIAAAVGFASTAAFCAAFHKVVGVTPSTFRARRERAAVCPSTVESDCRLGERD